MPGLITGAPVTIKTGRNNRSHREIERRRGGRKGERKQGRKRETKEKRIDRERTTERGRAIGKERTRDGENERTRGRERIPGANFIFRAIAREAERLACT